MLDLSRDGLALLNASFASAFRRAADVLSSSDTSFNVAFAMVGEGTDEGGVSTEAGVEEEDAVSFMLEIKIVCY